MGELSTYSLIDFIPFSEVVYHRMFVRVNQWLWPGQIAALLAGLSMIWAGWRQKSVWVGWLLGAVWVCVGWVFHLRFYAELNWAAEYVGWAFLAQACLLVLTGHLGGFSGDAVGTGGRSWDQWAGLGLCLVGMFIYPVISPLVERSWRGIEVFGCAPNPTVLVTLGVTLLAEKLPWYTAIVPLIWCFLAGATAYALGTVSGLIAVGLGVGYVGVAGCRGLGVGSGETVER